MKGRASLAQLRLPWRAARSPSPDALWGSSSEKRSVLALAGGAGGAGGALGGGDLPQLCETHLACPWSRMHCWCRVGATCNLSCARFARLWGRLVLAEQRHERHRTVLKAEPRGKPNQRPSLQTTTTTFSSSGFTDLVKCLSSQFRSIDSIHPFIDLSTTCLRVLQL